MINKDKDFEDPEDLRTPEIFSDEKTEEKIHRHLSDENDEITDQDIKDVKTDFDEEIDRPLNQTELLEVNSIEKESTDDTVEKTEEQKDDPHPIVTPWNILGT